MLSATVRELVDASVDFDATRELSTTDRALDENTWAAIKDMGVLGLHLPEEVGGAGYSAVEVALVIEELGRSVAAVPYLSTVVASYAMDLAGVGSDVLASVADGSAVATVAFYESAHGDVVGDAVVEDGSLTGTKRYVTDGVHADVFVVSASRDGAPVLAVVAADADGVEVTPVNALDATRPLAAVTFDGVALADRSVGSVTQDELGAVEAFAAMCLASEQVGGAQRCMEVAVEYAKSRYQFGRAIGSFQAVKHKCADMLVAVEHARSAAAHAASSFEDETERSIAVPLARSVCSDAFLQIAGDTIQVLGGIGFTWEHEAHLYFKRAKADALLFGDVDVWRDRLADAVGL